MAQRLRAAWARRVHVHAHATATRNDLAATFDDAAFDAAVDIVGTHDVVSSDE